MENIDHFLKKYRTKRFAKGEVILSQDEVPEIAYIIKKGVVKVYNITAEGEEKPITLDVKDDMLPVGWVFYKLQRCQYFYGAFTDCELYCVPREDFVAYLKSQPEAMLSVFSHFVNRYVNYQMRINALEQSKASSKVLYTLHFLALRFGTDIKKDVVRIPLPLTQQDLANFMGLTRETTSMELRKLQKQGVISYRNQKYVIKTDKLDERLDEDYDQGGLQAESDEEDTFYLPGAKIG